MPDEEYRHPITVISATFSSDEEIQIVYHDANRNRSKKVMELSHLHFDSGTATGALLAALDALRDLVDAVKEEQREPVQSFQRIDPRR